MSLDTPDFLPDGTSRTGNQEYDALPRAVKDLHPREGWAWLSDEQKAHLIQTETEPEHYPQ
jgi:hypothetical protein